jgi:hypothetical protein
MNNELFDPQAKRELEDAIEYYNFLQVGLGNKFKESVYRGIIKIQEYPNAWQKQTKRSRRYILDTFPYKIIYYVNNDCIYIVAIANSHRHPDYWAAREEVEG